VGLDKDDSEDTEALWRDSRERLRKGIAKAIRTGHQYALKYPFSWFRDALDEADYAETKYILSMATSIRFAYHADKKAWRRYVGKLDPDGAAGLKGRRQADGRTIPPAAMTQPGAPVFRGSDGRRDWRAEMQAFGITVI